MTQIKEKKGICKSVVVATVVAIRGFVKNGFHCIQLVNAVYNFAASSSSSSFFLQLSVRQ